MKRAEPESIDCSLCKKRWPWKFTELPEVAAANPSSGDASGTWIANCRWACPECVDRGRAERGDLSKQNFGGLGSPPILSYWDQTRSCQYCGGEYVFTIGEQRFWFEERAFHVRANPIACPDCRRQLQAAKRAQQQLAELLQHAAQADWVGLTEIARLFVAAGVTARALEFYRRAKNRCTELDEVSKLKAIIADLERTGAPQPPKRNHWRVSERLENSRWR